MTGDDKEQPEKWSTNPGSRSASPHRFFSTIFIDWEAAHWYKSERFDVIEAYLPNSWDWMLEIFYTLKWMVWQGKMTNHSEEIA